MRIAIISDSHDNVPNIEKFIEWANGQTPSSSPLSKGEKVEAVIHCGDICAPAVVKNLLGPKLRCPVHLIFGNVADRERLAEVVKDFEHVILHGDRGELEFEVTKTQKTQKYRKHENTPPVAGQAENTKTQNKVRIAFVHYPDKAKELARTGKYDLVFYGHNHRPWDEMVGNCRVLNPGTLAGMFQKATFAVYETETGKAELILLEKIF